MDATDKILARINELLRYIAPGFIGFLLLVVLLDEVSLDDVGATPGFELYVLLPIILLSGVGIYAIHRYAIVWFLWRFVMWYGRRRDAFPPFPDELRNEPLRRVMFELDMQRILRGASTDPVVHGVSEHHARWSSLQHFLYMSATLSMCLPVVLLVIRPGHVVKAHACLCVGAGIIILAAALFSEYQNTSLDIWAATRYPDGVNSGETSHVAPAPPAERQDQKDGHS